MSCKGSLSETVYNALWDLYNSTNGNDWKWPTNSTIWTFPSELSAPCTNNWQGLICSRESMNTCFLDQIDLTAYGLIGRIPPSMGNFSSLTVLKMKINGLFGNIPCELGNLHSLQYLYLNFNRLTGTIPCEMGNLSSIVFLELYSNRLNGTIPCQLGNLLKLQELQLYSNRLSGTIPCELGNLLKLQDLELYSNRLSGTIPCELGNLHSMQYLYLNSNRLTGTIPCEIGYLSSILYLELYSNSLVGTIPCLLGNLLKIQFLDLHSNSLDGAIPCELGNLAKLQYLSCHSNRLSGTIPCELGILLKLKHLELYSNNLSGTIPSELGGLTLIEYLDLNENSFSGAIPPELGNLELMTSLLLSENCLSGTIPSELGRLLKITDVFLYSNKLYGAIPAELENLHSLVVLELYFNSLSGAIPCELGNLRFIEYLYVNSNSLSGTIPCELGLLNSTKYLYLNTNKLSGTIPSELGNLRSLRSLFLYSNSLTGTIPSEIGDLDNLVQLALFSNSLCGTFPKELGNLTQMQQFLVFDNSLTGTIPSEFGNLESMQTMYFKANQLTGTLNGDVLSNLLQLTTLDISANSLTGLIPSELAASNTTLLGLFLGNNMFTGTIPSAIGSCSLLEKLDLSSNFIHGNVTTFWSLSHLIQLQAANNFLSGMIPTKSFSFRLEDFDISNNYLVGSLARQFGNHTQLKNVAMGSNLLTGTIPDYLDDLPLLVSLNLSSNKLSGDLSGFVDSTGSLQSLDVSSNQLTGTLPNQLFELTSLQDVLLFNNCFSGSIPETMCSNSALEYLVLNQLASNCGSDVPKSLQPIFRGVLSQRKMSGSVPDCVWGMAKLTMLQLSGNGLTGSIAQAANESIFESLVLSSNQITGTIPTWIQMSSTLTQIDLSQNRLSGTFARSLHLSSQPSSLFKVSVNRLSGNLPEAIFQETSNLTLDVLNGNQFSCSSAEGGAGWGSIFTQENLPRDDPTSDTYICGSSLFDDYLLLTAEFLIIFVISMRLDLSKDLLLLLPRNSKTNLGWRELVILCGVLLILFVSFHSGLLLAQFSTHSEQYLWVTTAAFLRGWAPVFVIILIVGVGELVMVTMCSEDDGSNSINSSSRDNMSLLPRNSLSGIANILAYPTVHLLNMVAVVSANAAYVFATVTGLHKGKLFVIQFFLGCFKLVWNGVAIPLVLGLTPKVTDVTTHRVFMSLFAFIGGPFISTFFSASNCFLHAIVPQSSLTSTVVVPQYACSSSCEDYCNADFEGLCSFQCVSVCDFQQTSITTTSTPAWIYSYQCSSTLLLDYIPVLIATMAVSGLVVPCLVMCQYVEKIQLVHYLFRRFASRSMVTGEYFNVAQLGRFLRVKHLVSVTTMMSFGFASPLLGMLVVMDVLSWSWIWQILVNRQIEYLKALDATAGSSLDTSSNHETLVEKFSKSSDQAFQSSVPTMFDCMMVFAFVGVFWSLFMFDMIADVYGNLSGGMSMLVPLLLGIMVWIARRYQGVVRETRIKTRTVSTTTPGVELSEDCFGEKNPVLS